MSTKKKLLESAQKNIQKGQLGRAIKEYEEIISLDPGDIRHRQKLAELLTKANRNEEAVKEYTSLAKQYIDAVYYLKAIAVYKQIQKLEPANPEVSLTLASLNEKQGLIGNAVAEYNAALRIYESNGENRKALGVLESLLAIDPKNSAIRLRIAEKYFTIGEEGKALEGFSKLAGDLRDNGDENGFNHVANRLTSLFPGQAASILSPPEATPVTAAVEPEAQAQPPAPRQEPPHAPPAVVEQMVQLPAEVPPLPPVELPEEPLELLEELEEIGEEPSVAGHEWEEEIDLGALEGHAMPDLAPEGGPLEHGTGASPDEIGMVELELELEIVPELEVEPEVELEAVAELEIEAEESPWFGAELETEPDLELEEVPELEIEPELLETELELEAEPEEEIEAEFVPGIAPEPVTEETPAAGDWALQPPGMPADTFDLAGEIALFAEELDFDLPRRDNGEELFAADAAEMFKTSDLDREDAESHYSLGLAYKEMGLYEEAINEFIVASNSPARKIDCLLLQSQCHRDNGDLARAEAILSFLTEEPSISENELLSIKYELAVCHEISGETEAARDLFKEIVAMCPGFSDAASRLESL